MQIYVAGVSEVKKIDDYTVDFILAGPHPILLRNIIDFRIMSKSWAEKTRSQNIQDYKAREETYASRNANGTGPYVLKGWEPDKQIVFTVNKNWWGKHDGNISDFTYTPIKADATRVAALLSGDVDMVTDLPTQDVDRLRRNDKLKVIDGHEVRTIFIGLDQHNDELLFSSVKGRNPFKDARVRQALGLADPAQQPPPTPAPAPPAKPAAATTKSLARRSSKDLTAALCQPTQTLTSLPTLPSQVNLVGSNLAASSPNSGVSNALDAIMAISLPSLGARFAM